MSKYDLSGVVQAALEMSAAMNISTEEATQAFSQLSNAARDIRRDDVYISGTDVPCPACGAAMIRDESRRAEPEVRYVCYRDHSKPLAAIAERYIELEG